MSRLSRSPSCPSPRRETEAAGAEESTLMTTRWRLKPFDSGKIQALSRGARISPLVAQLLINRRIEQPERAVMFLQAKLASLNDPETLPGVREAAERIIRAIREDRTIVIYGDYAVDGV